MRGRAAAGTQPPGVRSTGAPGSSKESAVRARRAPTVNPPTRASTRPAFDGPAAPRAPVQAASPAA